MPTVAIVYFSAQGHTHRIAEAVADGVRTVPGATPALHRILGEHIVGGRFQNPDMMAALDAADAIVFGTPTYMGGYAAQFKAFVDAASASWFRLAWKDKIAAGFTHSMGLSGDKLNTLQGLWVNAMQHGMVWVGTGVMPDSQQPGGVNRLSSFSGAMAQTSQPDVVDEGDIKTAAILGARVAALAAKLAANPA